MARTPPVPKRPPKPATPAELRDAIRDEALRLGFDAVGFAPANARARGAARSGWSSFGAFVAQGFQGDMGWLGQRTEERADPATLWPRGAHRRVARAELRAASRSARGARASASARRSRSMPRAATITR